MPIIMIGTMTTVIAFPTPRPQPSRDELAERVRELVTAGSVAFDHPHFQLRLAQRSISMRQVLEVLKHGNVVDGPKLDPYGDWRLKLQRKVAGRRVQVVVAVGATLLSAVTVI